MSENYKAVVINYAGLMYGGFKIPKISSKTSLFGDRVCIMHVELILLLCSDLLLVDLMSNVLNCDELVVYEHSQRTKYFS